MAQEDGEPPCCYGPPPDQSSQGLSVDTQNLMILLGVLIEVSLSQPVSETGVATTATIASNRPAASLLPKGNFQAIGSRRTGYRMV